MHIKCQCLAIRAIQNLIKTRLSCYFKASPDFTRIKQSHIQSHIKDQFKTILKTNFERRGIHNSMIRHFEYLFVDGSPIQVQNKTPIYSTLATYGRELTFTDSSTKLIIKCKYPPCQVSLIAQLLKNTPAKQETQVQFQGQEDPLEKGQAPRYTTVFLGFPGGSTGNESACNLGDMGSIPGQGKYAGEGNGNPLRYTCLENSMDR